MDQQSPTSKLLLALAILLLLGCSFSINGSSGKDEEAWFRTARVQMVEQQLRQRGIRDERVLQAMATIPRHLFVPPTLRSRAYDDGPLPNRAVEKEDPGGKNLDPGEKTPGPRPR